MWKIVAILYLIPSLGFGYSYCIEQNVSAYPTGKTTLDELAAGLIAEGYKNVVEDKINNRVTFTTLNRCAGHENDGSTFSAIGFKPTADIAKETLNGVEISGSKNAN